jgi:CheY-like chemotaxis protein
MPAGWTGIRRGRSEAKENMLKDRIILLVEDDPDDVCMLERAFEKAGWRGALRVAQDGEQAIEYLGGRGRYVNRELYPMPFLILLDLKMPGRDGFEVLRWVRADQNLKRLLIVVLTSSNLEADVDRAYELGANSYLVKPVGFQEMVNMVQRFETYWAEINRTPTPPAVTKPISPEPRLS